MGAKHKNHRVITPDGIRHAIANSELFNVYQPKKEVATGALVGVETLVRWRHPEEGVILPDQFISVAEENNLIDDLTRNVLTMALKQGKRWHDEGLPLRVAVYISMDNLGYIDFADYVINEITVV